MKERIQKIIASTGHCSRRKAEVLIKEGKITVNDKKVKLGFVLDNEKIKTAKITINGKKLNLHFQK